MDAKLWLRLLPNMEVLEEELRLAGIECRSQPGALRRTLGGVRLWRSGMEVRGDLVYVAGEELPPEGCALVTAGQAPGRPDTICCSGVGAEELLNLLLEVFGRFREQELMIDQLVCRGASLQELCDLAAVILENPVCIHDDWFILVGMSQGMPMPMQPEQVAGSARSFVPRELVEEFQHDADYVQTYAHHSAQLWKRPDGRPMSLYVNLWDGAVYRGRLLVIMEKRSFRLSDFLTAEVLTQRAMLLMRMSRSPELGAHRSMDSIVLELLQGHRTDPVDQRQFLEMLGWNKEDRMLCIRINYQGDSPGTVMEHVLHSDLFQIFPGCYILLSDHEQCVLLNLSRESLRPGDISHRLAPLCRDYCLYAGISSPVSAVRELSLAYCQAGIALDRAYKQRNDRWIVLFSECVLDHLTDSVPAPLAPRHLVAPELMELIDHDRRHGTQYFETLRCYLRLERDIPKTAQALIIHRTTLLYRLKKLQELVSLELEDPQKRLYLLLSLWILDREHQSPAGEERKTE